MINYVRMYVECRVATSRFEWSLIIVINCVMYPFSFFFFFDRSFGRLRGNIIIDTLKFYVLLYVQDVRYDSVRYDFSIVRNKCVCWRRVCTRRANSRFGVWFWFLQCNCVIFLITLEIGDIKMKIQYDMTFYFTVYQICSIFEFKRTCAYVCCTYVKNGIFLRKFWTLVERTHIEEYFSVIEF